MQPYTTRFTNGETPGPSWDGQHFDKNPGKPAAQRTPGPWILADDRGMIFASNDRQAPLIAQCPKESNGQHGVTRSTRDANAAFIVTACNAHDELVRKVEGLETLRPVWAEGWNDGSVSEQVCSAGLAQIWKLLGATNQTECMQKLAALAKVSQP